MMTASMLLTAALLAQVGPHPGPYVPHHPTSSTPTNVTLPSKLTAGDQFYQGNISGFRRYLNEIQQTDRELFRLLDLRLRQLEDQEALALTVGYGGFATGMAIFGFAFYSGIQPGTPRIAGDGRLPDWLLLAGGSVLFAIGSFGAMYLLRPSSDQFLEIINSHNRARPERPLRLQLGFAPATRGHGGVALALATF